jgi:6-pyruvoyl-tetrahydropterin synthase
VFEAGITLRFSASHRLKGDFGAARELHAHDYRLDVSVRGPALRSDGVLLDITVLETACRQLIAEFDGQCLDDVPALADINTTMEALAERIFTVVAPAMSNGVEEGEVRVTVWESPTAWGAYEGVL